MKVKLVSYTQPHEEYNDRYNFDKSKLLSELIAFCARVSNPTNQTNTETSERLIKYLIKHKHWSPLEMVSACLEIETTRDIARQLLRHRSFSFQELSQRYANPTEELDFVLREARLQDAKNRQNSLTINDINLQMKWKLKQEVVLNHARDAYKWAIDNNIAKEQARAVLPEGLTISRLYVNGTIRSWVHYLDVRCGNGTQKEHMELAKACAEVIANVFPLVKE